MLHVSRRAVLVGASALAATHARAQQRRVRIGVLSDLSGIFADLSGAGSVLAATMAVEDSGLNSRGWSVDVISADMQNKADVGATITRRWIDTESVDVIVDIPNSAVALAANGIVREKNKVYLASGTATSALTGSACSPNTVHWTYDTYQLASTVGRSVTALGGDTWFFLTADYAAGTALQNDTTAVATAAGAKVLGSIRMPLNSSDFSSFLFQAQASGAKVIGLAAAGADAVNCIKQAAEFQITNRQILAPIILFLTDIHSLGLPAAKGLTFSETFYWDLDDGTRRFSERFTARLPSRFKPTMVHAGVYSSILHYLKVVAGGADPKDGAAVVAAMKRMPTDDPLFGQGTIQDNGRKIHPAYVFRVKEPSESREPWDYYRVLSKVAGERAFRDPAQTGCSLVR